MEVIRCRKLRDELSGTILRTINRYYNLIAICWEGLPG
jgi:hypothetical protein